MNDTLSGYRIFFEVANCGNISKAASKLYISQPAISKSIQKLEDALNVRLFIRSSKGVILTPEGELLYRSVKSAFDSLDSGIEQIQRMANLGMGTLRIGVSSTLCRHMLLPYLKDFIRENPNITVSISTTSSNETLQQIEDQKIDVGLVGKPEHMEDIQFDALDEIKDCFVATEGYISLLEQRGITNDQILSSSTLMMLDKNNMSRQFIDDFLAKNHIKTKEALDVSDLDLLIDLARIGVGVACVVRNFVQEDLDNGNLVEIPLEANVPSRQVGFAYKKSHLQNPALDKFLSFVLD